MKLEGFEDQGVKGSEIRIRIEVDKAMGLTNLPCRGEGGNLGASR